MEKIAPEIVIIVDCINSNHPAGHVSFKKMTRIYTSPIDTHSGLIDEFIKLIKPGPKWYILGIQPHTLNDIDKISDIVKDSANELIKILNILFQ